MSTQKWQVAYIPTYIIVTTIIITFLCTFYPVKISSVLFWDRNHWSTQKVELRATNWRGRTLTTQALSAVTHSG